MQNIIKQSMKQHFIIWWTLSCFALASICGVIYLAIETKQNHVNAYENLFLWIIIWAYLTIMGLFTGVLSWLIDVRDRCKMDKIEGSNDVEENQDFNVDGNGDFDTIMICRKDGPITGEQFV